MKGGRSNILQKQQALLGTLINQLSHFSLCFNSHRDHVLPVYHLHTAFCSGAVWQKGKGHWLQGRFPGSKSQLCQAIYVTLGDLWCLSSHICKMGSNRLTLVKHLEGYIGCLPRAVKETRMCHPKICLFDIQILF